MNNPQNIENNSPTEIPPSRRVYSFKNLPPQTQENLLRLQNTDGDFLKISGGETEKRVALLILMSIAAIFLAAIVADSALDLKRIIVFSVDALLILIWLAYLIRGIYNAFKTPLKNRIYLTPTEVIETLDGMVRCRELIDANEIVVNKFSTDIGRRNKLDIKFDNGDFYQFYIPGMANSKQISLMQNWQEKAVNWQRESISTLKRGDADYLKSQDIFSNLSQTKTAVLQKQFRRRNKKILLIITILLLALNSAFIFFINK